MATLQKYQNKGIAIYGMGLTGCSAAIALKKLGTKIFCWDDNAQVRKKIRNFNFLDYLFPCFHGIYQKKTLT